MKSILILLMLVFASNASYIVNNTNNWFAFYWLQGVNSRLGAASVAQGTYDDGKDLATAVETALNNVN